MSSDIRVVYSTENGGKCKKCGKPLRNCICKSQKPEKKNKDSRVRVEKSSKGRGGKTVSVISGLPLSDSNLKVLAKKLKGKCGSGGTVKNQTIEIQGDHCDLIVSLLKQEGYDAKRSGG